MGAVDLMEMDIMDKGDFDSYDSMKQSLRSKDDGDFFDMVSYAMAISRNYRDSGIDSNQLYFIGGFGVLGNIVNKEGVDSILSYRRNVHDLDLAVRSVHSHYILTDSLDTVDLFTNSHSVPGKKVLRGYSWDSQHDELSTLSADVFTQSPGSDQDFSIHSVPLSDKSWDETKYANFFGIQVPVLEPVSLLELKLQIKTPRNGGLPRRKDIFDIFCLTEVLVDSSLDPSYLSTRITPTKKVAWERSIDYAAGEDGFGFKLDSNQSDFLQEVFSE